MALSGTLTGTCVANNGASSRYDYKIEWSATQNVTANTSTITATAYVRSNNSAYSTSTNWTSIINGTTVKTFSYHIQASAGWVNFGSKTWTVNHNADGTCTTSISGSFSGTYNGSYVLRSGSVSGNITLNTIPRASSFSLNRTSGTIGTDNFVVTINRASSSFTHTVIYKFGSGTHTKANKTTATTVTVDVGIGDCSQIPNATSGTGTITVDTYNGSTKIGTASKTITLNVPSNVVPTISHIGLEGNNLLGGVYVADKSTVKASIYGAEGVQGSSIKSFHISGAGINSTAWQTTSGTLSAGTHTITGKVTDSRGRTASKSTSITVHSYTSPTLSASVYRCNSSGTAVDDGTYVRANISVNVDNVGNTNVNAKQYKIEWKRSTSSSWATLTDWTNLTSYTPTWTADLGSGWDNTVSYDVRISVKDSYNTVSVTRSIGTVSCVLNVEQNGVGVGKIHERGALDVGGDIYMNSTKVLGATHPVNGNWFRGVPSIGSDGVMEVGKYIDFHNSNSTTVDYDNRITSNGNTLEFSGNIKTAGSVYVGESRVAVQASHGGLDLGGTDRNTAICSANVPTWWNGTSSHTIYTTGNKPSPQDIGAMKTVSANGYYGMTANGDEGNWVRTTKNGIIPYQSGTNASLGTSSWIFAKAYIDYTYTNEIKSTASSKSLGLQGYGNVWITTGTNGSTGTVFIQSPTMKPHAGNTVNLGDNTYKWKAVYSNNGTIQTSDERFKVKQGYTDTEDCFDMVKDIKLYNYVMLDKNKETLSRNRLGKLAMESIEDDAKVHMGIMAQDLQKYKCGKHILVEGEYEFEDETSDTMLNINPYDMTMAIMGALKEEIRLREQSDARITQLEQEIETLKSLVTVGA